jgi:hypothetical protein
MLVRTICRSLFGLMMGLPLLWATESLATEYGVVKGSDREFVVLPYELSWSHRCDGVPLTNPSVPRASRSKKGAIVIATVSPLNDRPEQVYATLDFWHYAAVKRWVRWRRRPASRRAQRHRAR